MSVLTYVAFVKVVKQHQITFWCTKKSLKMLFMLFLHTKNLETKRCLTAGYVLWFCWTLCAKNSSFVTQTPSWELIFSHWSKIPCVIRKIQFNCCVHNSTSLVTIRSQMNPFHDILGISLSISHHLRLGFPSDLYPSHATCIHFSSSQCVSRERVVKNSVRGETVCITIQRANLIRRWCEGKGHSWTYGNLPSCCLKIYSRRQVQ